MRRALLAAALLGLIATVASAQTQPPADPAAEAAALERAIEQAIENAVRQGAGSTPPEAPVEAPEVSEPGVRVSLRGLDKLTGETRALEADVGGAVAFDRLRIEVAACFAHRGARSAESSVFLQIFDTKYPDAPPVFSGWMLASSPALSALDHPRYDVWLSSCSTV